MSYAVPSRYGLGEKEFLKLMRIHIDIKFECHQCTCKEKKLKNHYVLKLPVVNSAT